MRGFIERAVREGFEDALEGRCPGREDPEDRCPMRPRDGCLCAYRQWVNAPWWRRFRMEEPKRPAKEDVLAALFDVTTEEAVTEAIFDIEMDGAPKREVNE